VITAWVTFSPDRLGRFLELAQNERGDLRGRVHLAAALHPHVPVVGLQHLVGNELRLTEHLVVAPPHEALDGEDGVLRVGDGLTLRHLPTRVSPSFVNATTEESGGFLPDWR